MKLKDYKKEDLELMGYDDIAVLVLQEVNKKMKITDLFKKVCNLLGLSDKEYEQRIGDFFELLSTNKNFIMLENGYWDLKSKHNSKVIIDEDDEEIVDSIDEEDEIDDEEDEDIFYDGDDDDDVQEDELKDLVVIDGDEEANSL